MSGSDFATWDRRASTGINASTGHQSKVMLNTRIALPVYYHFQYRSLKYRHYYYCHPCRMLCFFTRVAWVCLLLCKEEGSSPVSVITGRMDMGLYEVPLSMSLSGLWMGTMLANFHVCGIMLVLRAVFTMLVRNTSPRRSMCFR